MYSEPQLLEVITKKTTEIRRHIHRHPELSDEEFATTAYIKACLQEAGVRIVDSSLKTGVIAEIGGLHGGPVIALRADIDALPIHEQTGLSFESEYDGKMHACGHDFHTAALIGTAILLKEWESELQGTIRLIFQPAEENATGARQMIDSGVLEDVKAIFGMHNKPDLPVGTIGIKSGPLMAAADAFVVEINGKGSHAAVPDAGNDPIVAASHMVTALQTIVSRNVSPLESAVVSVTKIQSGSVWNVIPQQAFMEGTIRTFDKDIRSFVMERFQHIVEGIADVFGTEATVRWREGPPPIANDKVLAQRAHEIAAQLGYQSIVPALSSAGEDFAVYQEHVPGLFVFMGTSGTQEWHHPSFTLDEAALPVSVLFLANLARAVLTDLNH